MLKCGHVGVSQQKDLLHDLYTVHTISRTTISLIEASLEQQGGIRGNWQLYN